MVFVFRRMSCCRSIRRRAFRSRCTSSAVVQIMPTDRIRFVTGMNDQTPTVGEIQ